MNSHINVTVKVTVTQQQSDMRIPTAITVRQLVEELLAIFNITVKPASYRIKVCNKQLLLTDLDRLEDYPITDGDRIELLLGGGYHDNERNI